MRAFDHHVNLDAILLATQCVAIEIEGHRLAGLDGSAEFAEDIAVGIDKLAAIYDNGTIAEIQDVDPSCLPEGDTDRNRVDDNNCASMARSEREQGCDDCNHFGNVVWCFHNFSFLGCDICPVRLFFGAGAGINVLLSSKAETPLGTHHDWATYFADNRGFETLSAPASFAATLRGFTFCVAAPAAPLADDTDKRNKECDRTE
jgi:hypothetical protein